MSDQLVMVDTAIWDGDGVWDDDTAWNDYPEVAALLPPNATAQEFALEQATARVGAVPVPVRSVWNPASCPANLLPWLAWALSVDEWDPSWPEAQKRGVIVAAADIHRKKGTRAAVLSALRSAGFGEAELVEDYGRRFYDGSLLHDGSDTYSQADHWAEYRVILSRPITIAQGQAVRRILAAVAPLRSHLKAMDFQETAHLYNGAITYDGTYSHGVA